MHSTGGRQGDSPRAERAERDTSRRVTGARGTPRIPALCEAAAPRILLIRRELSRPRWSRGQDVVAAVWPAQAQDERLPCALRPAPCVPPTLHAASAPHPAPADKRGRQLHRS